MPQLILLIPILIKSCTEPMQFFGLGCKLLLCRGPSCVLCQGVKDRPIFAQWLRGCYSHRRLGASENQTSVHLQRRSDHQSSAA